MLIVLTPPVIAIGEDRLEPNNEISSATSITSGEYPNLVTGGEDNDYYEVSLQKNEKINVFADFTEGGDGDGIILLFNPGGSVMERANTGSSEESISYTATQTGAHYIRIFGAGPDRIPYSFSVDKNSSEVAAANSGQIETSEDNQNTNIEPNDDRDSAALIDEGEYQDLRITEGDDDYYAVELSQNQELTASINFDDSDGDLDMRLISPSGERIERSNSVNDDESVSLSSSDSGTYYIQVYGYEGDTTSYSLSVNTAVSGSEGVPVSEKISDDSSSGRYIIYGIFIIIAIGYYILRESNNTEKNSKVANSEKEATTSELNKSKTSLEDYQTGADAALKTAEKAKSEGKLNKAIDAYEETISYYESARESFEADDIDSDYQLGSKINSAQSKLQNTRNLKNQRTDIAERLQSGERNFQEAIIAHLEDDQTLKKLRFRQARDKFREAIETIDVADEEALIYPIEIEADTAQDVPSTSLDKVKIISKDTVGLLRDENIEYLEDITANDDSPWIPVCIEELVENSDIDDATATKLTLISWWQDDHNYIFKNKSDVTRRYEQSDTGYDTIE